MIWLIGRNGMLGSDIELCLKDKNIKYIASDAEVDITDYDALSVFAAEKPEWIINCAAYNQVDLAESEPRAAELLNVAGAENIAKYAASCGAKMIHFSTDYVYDGRSDKPYTEEDPCSPLSVYGKSKMMADMKVSEVADKYFIFRISWLYGRHGKNFAKTMLKLFKERDELRVVDDQVGAPTYSRQLAENIVSMIISDSEKYGLYLYSDEGVVSWHDFAVKIYEMALSRGMIDRKINIMPISSEDYKCAATRPKYSVFNRSKAVSELNFTVRPWDANLSDFFNELGEDSL